MTKSSARCAVWTPPSVWSSRWATPPPATSGLDTPVRLVVALGYAAPGDPLRPKKRKAPDALVTEKE